MGVQDAQVRVVLMVTVGNKRVFHKSREKNREGLF